MVFWRGQAFVKHCKADLTVLPRLKDEVLDCFEHIAHGRILRMKVYLRNASVFTPDSCTQKCAAHNRNFLACTGEAKTRFKLASQQSTYNLVAAVLCDACNVIFIDRLIVDDRSHIIYGIADLGHNLGQTRLPMYMKLASVMDIYRTVILRMRIRTDKTFDDFL